MSDSTLRYIVKPNDPPRKHLEVYSHMVWDCKEDRPVAYASIFTAVDYAGQLNEKGYIEP